MSVATGPPQSARVEPASEWPRPGGAAREPARRDGARRARREGCGLLRAPMQDCVGTGGGGETLSPSLSISLHLPLFRVIILFGLVERAGIKPSARGLNWWSRKDMLAWQCYCSSAVSALCYCSSAVSALCYCSSAVSALRGSAAAGSRRHERPRAPRGAGRGGVWTPYERPYRIGLLQILLLKREGVLDNLVQTGYQTKRTVSTESTRGDHSSRHAAAAAAPPQLRVRLPAQRVVRRPRDDGARQPGHRGCPRGG